MDVFSTVCGIVGIVDVLTRSIVKLHDISKMLQSANITLVALIGELTATRTALNQLRDCVERHRDGDQHYTMIMELDTSLSCCQLLVDYVDGKVLKLDPDNIIIDTTIVHRQLSLADRITWTLADKDTSLCLQRLGRIVSALGIVQQGLETNNISQQSEILAKNGNRAVLQQVKDDTTSMRVLLDGLSASSLHSSSTGRSSVLNVVFGFDSELLSHRLYQSTYRRLLKRVGNTRKVSGKHESEEMSKFLAVPPEVRRSQLPSSDHQRLKRLLLSLEYSDLPPGTQVVVRDIGALNPFGTHSKPSAITQHGTMVIVRNKEGDVITTYDFIRQVRQSKQKTDSEYNRALHPAVLDFVDGKNELLKQIEVIMKNLKQQNPPENSSTIPKVESASSVLGENDFQRAGVTGQWKRTDEKDPTLDRAVASVSGVLESTQSHSKLCHPTAAFRYGSSLILEDNKGEILEEVELPSSMVPSGPKIGHVTMSKFPFYLQEKLRTSNTDSFIKHVEGMDRDQRALTADEVLKVEVPIGPPSRDPVKMLTMCYRVGQYEFYPDNLEWGQIQAFLQYRVSNEN